MTPLNVLSRKSYDALDSVKNAQEFVEVSASERVGKDLGSGGDGNE